MYCAGLLNSNLAFDTISGHDLSSIILFNTTMTSVWPIVMAHARRLRIADIEIYLTTRLKSCRKRRTRTPLGNGDTRILMLYISIPRILNTSIGPSSLQPMVTVLLSVESTPVEVVSKRIYMRVLTIPRLFPRLCGSSSHNWATYMLSPRISTIYQPERRSLEGIKDRLDAPSVSVSFSIHPQHSES